MPRILLSLLLFLAAFAASAQTSTANRSGLWWVPTESGWGLHVEQQGDIVFAALYAYRAERTTANNEPEWFVMSRGDLQANGSFTGDLYRVTGTAYNVTPFVPIGAANVSRVGTMTVAFTGASSGTLTYNVGTSVVTKAIQKQVFGSAAASCTFTTDTNALRTATNYTGLWWNPAESGWGIPLTHQDDIVFAVPFIYDASGRNTWVVASGLRKQADGSFFGDLYRVTGSAFNASPFIPLTADKVTVVGTMRLTFFDGNTGSLVYSIGSDTVVKSITRQVFNTQMSVCSQGTPSLSYTDKVYTLYVGTFPYVVTKTGVTKVTNKTQFTTGFFPIALCKMYEMPIENGIIPVQCTTASDNVRRTFYINPSTDELLQYTGTFAFDSTKWHDVPWGAAMPYGNLIGPSGGYVEAADGIYWGPWSSSQTLKFSPKVGNGYDFNNVLVIAQASGPDVFKLVMKYSH